MDKKSLEQRQPLKTVKWLEVPIQKFNNAVPHFVNQLREYIDRIIELQKQNQWNELQRQHLGASKTASQLTTLIHDMDTLRLEVAETDIHKFDKLISHSRADALKTIDYYKALAKGYQAKCEHYKEAERRTEYVDDNYKEHQLQIVADLSEDVRNLEQDASHLESLQGEIAEISSLYQDFAQLVHEQGHDVDRVETLVETSGNNVLEGERMLCQAAKYKTGAYPLLGALIGSIMGGPVGLVAGFKLGGLTAFGCALLGFAGGRMIKNQNEATITEATLYRKELENKSL